MTVTVLINVDVPDLEAAIAFYTTAFGLGVGRRFGMGAAELTGWPAPLFLLRKEAGSIEFLNRATTRLLIIDGNFVVQFRLARETSASTLECPKRLPLPTSYGL